MNQTYKATGINLKGMPLGETDRLVTILTSEYGLVSAIAPGARKYKSRLRGRSELFVINDLLLVKGRSLDKIIQAETVYTYPGLSQNVGKLAAAQYLGELSLSLALSDQSQLELYELLKEHLRRIEQLERQESVYPYIAQAVFHLLALAGIAPQVYACCLTQKLLSPSLTNLKWQVGFSFLSGGIIDLSAVNNNNKEESKPVKIGTTSLQKRARKNQNFSPIDYKLNALELYLMQQFCSEKLPQTKLIIPQNSPDALLNSAWIRLELILRRYAEYHLGLSIRSAQLVDELYLLEF